MRKMGNSVTPFTSKAAPNTHRFVKIILLLIGCVQPGKLHLIRTPKIRVHLGFGRSSTRGKF
jgi:hypothetical protein